MPHTGMTVIPETVFDCSFLDGGVESNLGELPEQDGMAFQGMIARGAFDHPSDFVDRVPKSEQHLLFAYLNNRDVQQQPAPDARRVIVDVYDELVAAGLESAEPAQQEAWLKSKLPFLYEQLRRDVFSWRLELPDSQRNRKARTRPWLFEEVRPGLRRAWLGLTTVVGIGTVGKVLKPTLVPLLDRRSGLRVAPTNNLFLVPTESHAVLGLLNSLVFEAIARRFCGTLESRLSFSPMAVFPYFPFPWKGEPTGNEYVAPVLNPPSDVEQRLGPIANTLLKLREETMLSHGFCGPTALYNAFDDPGDKRPAIQALREAHMALETAVLAEYGWSDLAGPERWVFDRPWIDGTWRFVPNAETRREYLRRLERLNHEQAAQASISTPAVI